MVCLARCLAELSHRVRLFTSVDAVAFCARRGVDAVPVFAHAREALWQAGGVPVDSTPAEILALAELERATAAWEKKHPHVLVGVKKALDDFGPHALVFSGQTSGLALEYERTMGVPAMIAHFSRSSLEAFACLESLQPPRPSFLAASRLIDKFARWDRAAHRTGPWALLEGPSKAELADGGHLGKLRAFLEEGAPPVVVSWGSMLVRSMSPWQMLALALQTLREIGRRGVILGGWAGLDELGRVLLAGCCEQDGPCHVAGGWPDLEAYARSHVCFLPEAPHAWLFPRCSCVVHHGGAGTVQAAIRAGVPSVVTPVAVEHAEISAAVQRLGAGVGLGQPLPRVTPRALGRAILQAEADTSKAVLLQSTVLQEGGGAEAAAVIDGFVRREVLTGLWGREAALVQRRKREGHGQGRGHP